jgi:hypothetical protein
MKRLTRIFFVSLSILTCAACFLSTNAAEQQPFNVIEYYKQYIKGKGYKTLDDVESFGDLPYGHLNYEMRLDVRKRFNQWKREHQTVEEHSKSSTEAKPHKDSNPEEVLHYYNTGKNKATIINIAKHIFIRDKEKVEDGGGRGEVVGYVANKMCTHGVRVVDLWKHKDTKYPTIKGEDMKEMFGVSGRQFLKINTKNQLNVFSEQQTPDAVLNYISGHMDSIFTMENVILEYVGSTQKKFYRISIVFPLKNSGHYYESKSADGIDTHHITIHLYAQDVIEDLLNGGSGMSDLGDVTTICPSKM